MEGEFHTLRLKGLFELYSLPQNAIPYPDLNDDTVATPFERMLECLDDHRAKTKALTDQLRQQIDVNIQRTATLFDRGQS